jgi:DNA-binding transcriptional LysR family regulator
MMTELRGLRYLVGLAKKLHYARAAEDLGITQSALSKAIQALEREMGVRLFDRDQSGVTITDAGQRIVEKAEALLASANDFDHLVRLTSQRQEGRICFGMTPVVMQALVPNVIPSRLRESPNFLFEAMARDPEQLWQLLTARDIEFFVSQEWNVPDVLPVRIDLLGEFPIGLAVRPDHPLLRDPTSAEQFPVLLPAFGNKQGRLPFPLRYALPGAVHLFEDTTALSRLVQASDAIWMIASYAILPELEKGELALLPWPDGDDAPSFRVAIYSLARRSLSPTALELKGAFQKQIRTLDDQSAAWNTLQSSCR